MKYDYLIVGAGLFGATVAYQLKKSGKKVFVIDKRPTVGGNAYTEEIEKIHVHKYGAHIFHTNNEEVWKFVNLFADFSDYVHSPVANYKGGIYSLPFNMNTFFEMWGISSVEEAKKIIGEQRKSIQNNEPENLEEQAICLVGNDLYEKLIKGYTQKQWGRNCQELPAFIIKRIPVRFSYNNNYFDAIYQGIPRDGYTKMIQNMLEGVRVNLNEDYLLKKDYYDSLADQIIYTGPIDAYYKYCFGTLEYRSLRFENELLHDESFQNQAVVNYTDEETPYTRIIEHKWFQFGVDDEGNSIPKTVITREYSREWKDGEEPYYPINDEKNNILYLKYKELADKEEKVFFGGRLGEYKYYDMDMVVAAALELSSKLLDKE